MILTDSVTDTTYSLHVGGWWVGVLASAPKGSIELLGYSTNSRETRRAQHIYAYYVHACMW